MICNVCMNMLDNFSKLKHRLWQSITKSKADRKPIKFEKIWNIFASLKVEGNKLEEDILPQADLYHPLTPSTSAPESEPFSLVTLTRSELYDQNAETELERREYYRSKYLDIKSATIT